MKIAIIIYLVSMLVSFIGIEHGKRLEQIDTDIDPKVNAFQKHYFIMFLCVLVPILNTVGAGIYLWYLLLYLIDYLEVRLVIWRLGRNIDKIEKMEKDVRFQELVKRRQQTDEGI